MVFKLLKKSDQRPCTVVQAINGYECMYVYMYFLLYTVCTVHSRYYVLYICSTSQKWLRVYTSYYN